MFDGEEQTIGKISGYFSNKDQNIRKKAHNAINDYYYSKQKDYDNILYELVNVRNKQAKKLGLKITLLIVCINIEDLVMIIKI